MLRLEDARLAALLTLPDIASDALIGQITDLVAGGVDLLICKPGVGGVLPEGVLAGVATCCEREDALLTVALADGQPPTIPPCGDGVVLSQATLPIGQIRAAIGLERMVGVAIASVSDGMLALEVGADFLLHPDGEAAPACFAALIGATGTPLFAAAAPTAEASRALVDAGVFRLVIDVDQLRGDVTEWAASYSRLLGRCM